MSSSTEELDLLERVFLRIGSAESDEQLEIAVNKFLIPVLLKLSSPNEGVRKKVMELLVHINKRIKRRPTVQLPVEALLAQYRDPNASSFLINFSILYIKIGFPRLPPAKQEELAPILLFASERKPKMHQDSLLLLLTSIIGNVKVPADAAKRRELFKLDEKPELMKSFSSFMLDMLLLPYVYISSNDDDSSSSGSQAHQAPETPETPEAPQAPRGPRGFRGHRGPRGPEAPEAPQGPEASQAPHGSEGSQAPETPKAPPPPQAPPGMCEYGYKRVTAGDTPMTPERLEQTKLGIVRFLTTNILPNEDIICHLIIAESDTRFTVANLADTELKRISGSVDWSNTTVANRLFHIYLGTPEVPPEKRNLVPQANRVTPANTRIRLKILPYLCRLEKEAILFPASVQVIFSSLKEANAKLKLHALNFALAIVRRADNHVLNKMGGMLYTGLLKLVWNPHESQLLRSVGYAIIGEIVRRMPHIINKNLIELQVFFENLSCDQADIRMAVRDSLLTMIDAFRLFMKSNDEPSSNKEVEKMEVDEGDEEAKEKSSKETKRYDMLPNRELMMIALLSVQVESKEPMARFVAVKYIAAVFDSDHVLSRYLLLLATGDSNSDVSSVTMKSLYAGLDNDEKEGKSILFPDFFQMCECIYEKAMIRLKNSHQRVVINNVQVPFNEVTFNEVLIYLRLCLAKSSSLEVKSKDLLNHPCDASPCIGRYIKEIHGKNPDIFNNYLTLVKMLLSPSCSLAPIGCLVEIVGTCPEIFAERFANMLELVTNLLNHTKEEVRESVALLMSIICVNTMNEEKLDETIRSLLKKLDGKSVESQHGSILALGHIVERKMIEKGDRGSSEPWKLHEEVILEIAKFLDSPQAVLVAASCSALGQICKSAPIPLPEKSDSGLSKYGLMEKLLNIINNTKLSTKVKEKSVRTCGMLCLGENFPFVKELLENFLKISKQTKDIDTHFSIGESIILCLEGKSSAEKRDMWKVKEIEYVKPPMSEKALEILTWLLDELVQMSSVPHPNMRQSVCVYLLSITKNLSFVQSVKDKLPTIQAVFMELLTENNELIQDIASKGLALVYENSTEADRKELVTKLLDQLLSGKRAVQQVSNDTKLFEEGQLGLTPSGGNLSTYKELCSLASELNQPDLIYKFMHLANHNAIWNSKKGAAFGFHTIASQANDELNEYLPKIIPRLYRYQYDPTPRIQQSMSNIWHSLVKDTQKTLDKYYNEILDDLLVNLTSNQWRIRISCSLAIADFFRGSRSILDAKSKLPSLWHSLFRVMDDVHEGTRLAAQNTGKCLAKLCVKACDAAVGKVNEDILQVVLSIFLPGITNTVAEVRNLCLLTVSQLVNSAGSSLKPNLITLILSLLEAAGELESVGLSYLSAQCGAESQTQHMIDSVRASLAKSHFTTQTVTKCVQYVEVEMLDELVPKVIEIMKNVNLGSKIACAHLIVLMAHQLGRSMEQHVGKMLAALVNGLLDRNTTVRKTYASTIGQILQCAKASSLERLFTKLSTWYFEKEDLNTRTSIGHTLQAAAHYNGELLKDYFPVVIPLIFFAMHAQKNEGEDNSHVTVWEEVWNELTPGYEASIRQHMDEICKIVEDAFASSSWTMKAQGGKCVQTIAIKLGENMDNDAGNRLIEMLLKALQGKTFPGKENIVKALAKVSKTKAENLKQCPDRCQAVVEALFRECGKSDPVYKRHSLEALGTVLEAFDSLDFFQNVYELSRDMIQKLEEKGDDHETSEDVNKLRNEKYATMEIVYISLGKSWPKNKSTQIKYQDVLLGECHEALEKSPRDIQVAILNALHSYVEKLHYFDAEAKATAEDERHLNDILKKLCEALHFSLGISKHTKLRKEALNIVTTLGRKLTSTGRTTQLKVFVDLLRDRIQEVEKDTTPEVRTRLTDVKEIFKN